MVFLKTKLSLTFLKEIDNLYLKNHHWLEENENSNTGDHGRVKITYEGSKLISECSFEFENDLGNRRDS
jgi:hypothetical protein